jgi:hypothetical protein
MPVVGFIVDIWSSPRQGSRPIGQYQPDRLSRRSLGRYGLGSQGFGHVQAHK